MAYIGSIPAYMASGVRPRDEFTGDGTQICFALSQTVPGSFESGVTVVLDNVQQQPVEAFTVVDTKTLTFSAVTGTFTKNETVTGGTSTATGTVLKVNLGSIVVRPLTGTFANGETVTGGSSSASGTNAVVSTNIGSGILFSEIPASGAFLYVVHEGNATYDLIPSAASVGPAQLSDNLRNFTVDTFTGNGSTTAFTLSAIPASGNAILVSVDGIFQTVTTNYTLSSNTVTFTAAPDSGSAITIIHLGFSTASRTGLVDGSITPVKLSSGGPIWDTSSNLGVGVTPVTSKGTLQVGNIGYTDTGILAGFASSVAGYNQIILQNTSNNSSASANFNISNDAGTANTNYGELGINSSTFSGTGSFSQAGYVYLASASTDLVIGTYASKPIRFVVNSGATDAAIIDTAGNVGIGVSSPVTSTTTALLQVGGGILIPGNNLGLATNLYYQSGWKYSTNGSGGYISMSRSSTVAVEIGIAANNTSGSGAAATPTPSLSINTNGAVALQGGVTNASGVGITFPATQSASADANTLDDYEEGTWTPTIAGFSSAFASVTYTSQTANYTKIGNQVFLQGQVAWSAKSGGSGVFTMQGLPFSTVTTNGSSVPNIQEFQGFTFSGSQLGGEIFSNLVYFIASGSANTGGSVQVGSVANSGYFYFQITYRTS